MRTLNIILFFLVVNFACGQIVFPRDGEHQNWSREDFIEHKINIISATAYKFDENGNIKQDSSLLYRKQFDVYENKVFGIESNIIITSYGGAYLAHHNFELYYNAMGKIIKEKTTKELSKEAKDDGTIYNEIDYEYDSLNREIKKTEKEIVKYYERKRIRDSLPYLQMINFAINEYVYDYNNQKTECYRTVDSTRYLKNKKTLEQNVIIVVQGICMLNGNMIYF